MSDTVLDAEGREVKVGTRVRCGDYLGTVTAVTDWDGDVDDEGRSVGIAPDVSVDFDDGPEDRFRCYGRWVGYDEIETRCDDVEVLDTPDS